MKLLFRHGAPAAGKLTVAIALLQLVPGRLFDNHAAIDLARTLFDFGAAGFWELVHSTRYSALDIAAEHAWRLTLPSDEADWRRNPLAAHRKPSNLIPNSIQPARPGRRFQP